MKNINASSLTVKVVIGMGLGIVVGLILNGRYVDGGFVDKYLVEGLFHVVGKLFVNALKMIVVPLVFFSLICGVTGIGSLNKLGRVGGKAIGLYLMTTTIAIIVGVTTAVVLGIGKGKDGNALQETMGAEYMEKAGKSFTDVLIDIVPTNPIMAMAEGQMLSVIFFAVLTAISIIMVGKRADGLMNGVEMANEVMMKMVHIIMSVAPYAVFALLAKSVAELGLDLLGKLLEYAVVLAGLQFFHLFVVLMIVLKLFTGLNVGNFLRKMRANQMFAFSTSSSNATIPITLRTVTQRLGASNSVSSFTVPLGGTINMDGTAIMQGVATVFIANIYGIDLGIGALVTTVVMAVVASIGAAGVPSAGVIMLAAIFAQLGLPMEGIALILVVDRLLDMIRTVVNVTGDAVVTLIIAKSEGEFDQAVFDDPEAGVLDDDDSVSHDMLTE